MVSGEIRSETLSVSPTSLFILYQVLVFLEGPSPPTF